MSKASKIYQSLTPEQRQFATDKTISTTLKIGKWLGFLSKVGAYDAAIDSVVKNLLKISIACFVIAFLSIFAAAFSEVIEIFLVTPILVVVGIFLLLKRKKLKEKDINNYMRLFFIPILQVLSKKTGDDTRLASTIDFRNPRKVLKAEESKVGERNLKLYKPKYIVSRVELRDNSKLEFVVADDIMDFTWKKRNARGKTKYKSKTKYVHHCFIKMTLPKSEYKWTNQPAEGVEISEHNGDYLAKVKIKVKTTGTDNVLNTKHFFDGVQAIYDQLKPLNPSADVPERRGPDVEDDDIEMDESSLLVPYIWYGSSFDRYDYDNFDHADSGDFVTDDDSATVFDS